MRQLLVEQKDSSLLLHTKWKECKEKLVQDKCLWGENSQLKPVCDRLISIFQKKSSDPPWILTTKAIANINNVQNFVDLNISGKRYVNIRLIIIVI